MPSTSVATQEQFAHAYTRGYPKTKRFMLSRGISAELSEDLAQAAWARGWEYREQIRDAEKVDEWVNTIAMNMLRSSFRRPRTSELPDNAAEGPQASPELIDAQRLFTQCSSDERKLIEGHYAAGYTSAELGRQWGCSAVAIRVRLLRLRRRLLAAMTRKALPEVRGNLAL